MPSLLFSPELTALFQVILIDLVLAGDNAIVIGLAAAGLPVNQRTRAVLIGIAAATVLRIAFAMITTQPPAGDRGCACGWGTPPLGQLENVA
jgi:predicted tellurium resistance membrane protein TerC